MYTGKTDILMKERVKGQPKRHKAIFSTQTSQQNPSVYYTATVMQTSQRQVQQNQKSRS